MRRASGFTLIELVIVMIIISVGMLGITSLFSNTAALLSTIETVPQATQYAQGCAEKVLATRRDFGFAWFATNTFSCGSNPAGFTYSNASSIPPLVGSLYTGTSSTACPSGINCRDIAITVTSTANAALSSSITVMLVNY